MKKDLDKVLGTQESESRKLKDRAKTFGDYKEQMSPQKKKAGLKVFVDYNKGSALHMVEPKK